MKPFTAISFLLCMAALVSLATDPVRKSLKLIPTLSGIVVSLVGLLTIIDYSVMLISGSESAITGSSFFNLFLSPDQRMELVTAINFFVIGIVFILLTYRTPATVDIAHGFILLPFFLSYLGPLSYLLGAYHFYMIQVYPVPLNSGITLCFLCVALLFMYPDSWLMKTFTGRHAGSQMARGLLPGLIIFPVAIGWLRIKGEQTGLFESEVGVVLVSITYTVVFLWLVWMTAGSVNKTNKKNLLNEALLREAQRIASIGSWEWNIETGEVKWSDQMYQIFGEEKGKFIPTFDEFILHIHPDDRKHAEEVIRDVVAKGVIYTDEYRIIPRQTTVCYVMARADIFRDQNNKATRFFGTVMDITGRKKAEEALQVGQERFYTTLASIGDAVISTDVEGNILFLNRVSEELTGWKLQEALGKPVKEVFHIINEHTRLEVENPVKVVLEKGMIVGLANHTILVRKDGTEIPIDDSGAPIKGKEGKVDGVVLVFRDITDRKKAEEVIYRAKEDWERTFDAIPDLISIIDSNHRIRRANMAMAARLGLTPDQCIGLHCYKAIHNMDHPPHFCPHAKLIGDCHKHEVEIRENHLDSDFHVSTSPIFDGQGKLFGSVHVIRDITERKKIEEALRQSHLELEQKVQERTSELNKTLTELSNEQTRFREVLDMLPSYVALLTSDYHVSFANREFKKRFGEAPGKRCYEHLFNRNEPCEICHTYEVLKNNECIFWEWDGPDGNTYSVSDFPFTDTNGSKLILEIGSDITKIKEAVADRIARQVAEQANRTKSEFLADISHEIRTPMNAIIGFSDLLISTVKNEKQRSQINAIRSSGKSLLALINDILDVSKIEAGKMLIHPEPVNISMIINEIEVVFLQKSKEKGIGFFVETEKEVPYSLLLDETRLRQILFNLLDNAMKFTERGHVILTIDYKPRDPDRIDLILSVEDTGIGVPEDQHELIFKSFSQQKDLSERKYGGTGLGLTITRRLVELMGGTVSLVSEPGKGSIFKINLPDISIVPDPGKSQAENMPDIRKIQFREAKILIVDDNYENRKLLVDLFESTPIELIEASNGKEANELATKFLPDLILMDLRMPEMNGYEATFVLKNQDYTKDIPVIALSASPKIVFDGRSTKDIFDDFIMKPVIISDLIQLLKKHLVHKVSEKDKAVTKVLSGNTGQKLSKKQKQQLQELIKTLEDKYLPVFKEAISKQMIGQIDSFGQKLISLGEESDSSIVSDYGKSICLNVESFDIDLLMKMLRLFPEIIEELKNTMEA